MQTTAALVDDHPIFREGLKLLFELKGYPHVVGEASSANDAYELVSATRPDVVVLDLVFPEGANGIAVAQEILLRNPSQRILFLSMVKDAAQVAGALEAGALGYVTKDQTAEDLVDAVRAVAAGKQYLGSTLQSDKVDEQRRLLRSEPKLGQLASLTIRERQVFDLTIAGLTARDVGEKLSISARTVETHRARILRKLGSHSAADLVRLAARAGLLNT